jgi:hypothetical protein
MKHVGHRLLLILLVVLAGACSQEKPASAERPVSEKGEKLYVVRGIIMSRNAADNSLSINHEAIPGFMAAMQMDFVVRGASIDTLPADKSRIEANLHVTDTSYWITDVKKIP